MSLFWQFTGLVFAIGFGLLAYNWQDIPSEVYTRCQRMAEEATDNRAAFSAMNKSAFVLGFTGETGKALVQELAKMTVFSRVVLVGRREVKYEDEDLKKLEQKVVDFDKIDESKDVFQGLDVGFCCLGTTRGKSGKAGFIKVDHDYVLDTAKVAKSAGCQQFHLVSSVGANKNSWFLYPKTKGQVEEALKALEFPRLSIYRPGLLMCDRAESRGSEKVAQAVLKPWAAAFPTSGTIPVTKLATAMINSAVSLSKQTVETFENKAIHALVAEKSQKKCGKGQGKGGTKSEEGDAKTAESGSPEKTNEGQ